MARRILHSIGYGLDETAVQAVSEIVFRPATENGRAVDFEARARVEFRLTLWRFESPGQAAEMRRYIQEIFGRVRVTGNSKREMNLRTTAPHALVPFRVRSVA